MSYDEDNLPKQNNARADRVNGLVNVTNVLIVVQAEKAVFRELTITCRQLLPAIGPQRGLRRNNKASINIAKEAAWRP